LRAGRTGHRRSLRRNGHRPDLRGRALLPAEPNDHLTLIVVGPQGHDAGGRVVGEAEHEPPVGVRPHLMDAVERDGGLAGLSDPPEDPELPGGDHGLVNEDVGRRRRDAACKPQCEQNPSDHLYPSQANGQASLLDDVASTRNSRRITVV
jgi:hypothetical protein